ncbi:MAG: DNA polymerase III subunit gamma/tau [Balneolaceae bacterium]|nr:DNA polymerase III subunit gamma/tau [Balneolaceae bacterium]
MANNYRALTRTYRPQTFEDVVSQEHVSSTLKNAIKQNRLSHAYMFCGPRGVGKTTMARVLARAINNIDDTVDGESLSQTLNVVEIDAASNNKVEDVHHLREIVRVPPQSGRYKIFIIDEVHMLSKQAFNALLKTLEEPPPHAIFIFATTEPHKVLPTILSRVQRFDFKRISVDEITSRLREICGKEGITIDEESLHTIARKADGALRDALGLMDQAIAFCGMNIQYSELTQALNVVGNEELFEFTKAVANRDSKSGLLLIDRLLKEGIDIQEFLVSLTLHIRNLYVALQADNMHLVEATDETRQRYKDIAGHFSEDDLMRMLHLVSEAQLNMREVQQPRVYFEILMLKLVHMSRVKQLGELLSVMDDLKKKGIDPEGVSVTFKERGLIKESFRATEPGRVSGNEPEEKPVPEVKQISNSAAKDVQAEETPVKPVSEEPKNRSLPNRVEENTDEDDLSELLMGKPFLRSIHQPHRSNGKAPAETPVQKTPEVEISSVKLNGIEDIEEKWDQFLDLANQHLSQTLFIIIKDVRLKDLKGTELIISVNTPFAVTAVEEHKMQLSSLMKQTIGVHIRFKCVCERQKVNTEESLSPYDRFKQLQKKDTHLKTIVELFGAELEYT